MQGGYFPAGYGMRRQHVRSIGEEYVFRRAVPGINGLVFTGWLKGSRCVIDDERASGLAIFAMVTLSGGFRSARGMTGWLIVISAPGEAGAGVLSPRRISPAGTAPVPAVTAAGPAGAAGRRGRRPRGLAGVRLTVPCGQPGRGCVNHASLSPWYRRVTESAVLSRISLPDLAARGAPAWRDAPPCGMPATLRDVPVDRGESDHSHSGFTQGAHRGGCHQVLSRILTLER